MPRPVDLDAYRKRRAAEEEARLEDAVIRRWTDSEPQDERDDDAPNPSEA